MKSEPGSLPAGKYVALDRYDNPIIVTVFEHAIKNKPQVLACSLANGATVTLEDNKARKGILEQIRRQSEAAAPVQNKRRR